MGHKTTSGWKSYKHPYLASLHTGYLRSIEDIPKTWKSYAVHKSDRADALDRRSPIPCQMVSNEETTPIPQTIVEAGIEQTILDDAERYAKKRRHRSAHVLRKSGGLACSFLALNKVFGYPFSDVDESEVFEPEATQEKLPKGIFIIDSQNHFCQDGMKTDLRSQSFL